MNEKAKAACNVHAVLRNMENLCELDVTSKELIAASNVAIQFSVPEIDKMVLAFQQGTCKASRGDGLSYDMNLRFTSHEHLNLMIEGKKNPIPTKGLRHISFLKKTFTALADRLSYYLQPDTERLQNDKMCIRDSNSTENIEIPERQQNGKQHGDGSETVSSDSFLHLAHHGDTDEYEEC